MKPILLRALLTSLLALTPLAWSGCKNWADPSIGVNRLADDQQITRDVQAALGRGGMPGLEVKTFLGDVTLSGFASTEDQRNHAINIARNVPGVHSVVNHIALRSQGGGTLVTDAVPAASSTSTPTAPSPAQPSEPSIPQAEDSTPK